MNVMASPSMANSIVCLTSSSGYCANNKNYSECNLGGGYWANLELQIGSVAPTQVTVRIAWLNDMQFNRNRRVQVLSYLDSGVVVVSV